MKTPLEVLRDARELLRDKNRWAMGAIAFTEEGFTTAAHNKNAVRWCALGAIYKSAGVKSQIPNLHALPPNAKEATHELALSMNNKASCSFDEATGIVHRRNDSPQFGYPHIMEAFETTIARLEEKELVLF